MGCSVMLCGRFEDSEESRFQVSKHSNMGSVVLQGSCSVVIHEFCFQAAKRVAMDCVALQGSLFADSHLWHFQVRNVQIRAVLS